MGEFISKGLALNSQNRSVAEPSPVATNVLPDSLPCNAEEKKREKGSREVNVDTFPQQLNSDFTPVNKADMDTQKHSEDHETNSDCLSIATDNEPKSLLLNEELNEPQTNTQMSVTTDKISSSQSESNEAHCSTVQTSEEAVCETSCSNKSDYQCEEYSDKKIHKDTADVNVSDTENQGASPSHSLNEKNVTVDDAFEEANSEHNNQILSTEANAEASSVENTQSKRGYSSFSRGRPRKEKRVIKCEYCGRPFNHASAYIIHLRVHTGEKPFTCQDCGKAFAQLSNLRSHSKVHKSKRKSQTCPICGKVFCYKSVLKIHLRIHSGEKPYSCKVCGKSFTQACTARVHERVHWSIRPYFCSKCGKGFSQIGTHHKADPRKYFCPQCGRIFQHVGRLRAHMLTHSRGQSFTCIDCNRMFKNWNKFWIHQRLHRQKRGRFFCPKCGQGFRFVGLYNKHLQKHPELNAHACPFCPHTFSNAQKLRNHHSDLAWQESLPPSMQPAQNMLEMI
uniref:C2H2-type domain-containing protein n=1 Tax=Cyprinus carpio TaxID=7962 RepID=A0A8C1ZJN1_CYPCA